MKQTAIPMEKLSQILQTQLDNGGRANLVVTGYSMHPFLRHLRDSVVLVPPPETLKRGDLILYTRKSGQYVLHRIVKKPKNGAFICSGDNQWEPEEVCDHQVMALVESYIRRGKAFRADNFWCRTYVAFWVAMFPVRRPILALRRCFGKLCRKRKKPTG